MDKKLKDLVKEYEEYDKIHEIDFYMSDYSDLKELLKKMLLTSPFRNKNGKKILENIPVILKYTNNKNMDWITYKSVTKNKEFIDKLSSNIKYFRFPNNINELLNKLYLTGNLDKNIKSKDIFNDKMLENILEMSITSYTYSMLLSKMNNETRMNFLKITIKKQIDINYSEIDLTDEEKKYIADNIENITNYSNNLISLKDIVKENSDAKDKLASYINNNPEKVVSEILRKKLDVEDDNLTELITMIIEDINKNENIKFSDIGVSLSGGFSTVIYLNDKILKIGKDRGTKTFPNNSYILKPLLRKEIKTNSNKVFVEVTEKCDSNTQNITKEDLYNLYKNVRELGLIWTDVAKRNVGILTKDNKIHWRGNINPTDKVLELDSYRGTKELKKGDLVILDADFIFDENDSNIIYTYNEDNYQEEFEDRYQNELENNTELIEMLEDNNEIKEEKRHR